jgi:hypothetical protein
MFFRSQAYSQNGHFHQSEQNNEFTTLRNHEL